ncbi:MAG: hypothetical protein M3R08_10635 [Bacteroidota bacterium]|nr:hypothetical protein [Bacteroidota bacterium]
MRSLHIICIILCLFTVRSAFAQGKLVDRRDQAQGWFIPIHGEILAQGRKLGKMEVIIYRDNIELGRLNTKKNGRFELELDIDQMYTIRVLKNGYQEKLVLVDTSLPKDLVDYPDYYCFIDLLPVNVQNIDPFYTDFPSAIVRYNTENGGFYHSENYLTHIQTKLAGYAKAGSN